MAFVRFTETGKSYTPKVSINTIGTLGFSQGAVRRFDINDYEFAVLFFDAEGKKIGIKMTNDDKEEGVVKIRRGSVSGASIGAKSFLNYFNILPNNTSMYEVTKDENNNMLIIDLKTARERENR